MALDLEEEDGQTPLDPDEKAGLKAKYITTQAQLNDREQTNILEAARWLQRKRDPDVLSEGFCRDLHKQMFGATWKWAGTFRRSDKNIGCDWRQVAVKLKNLFENTRWWIDNKTFPPDEIAARFHRDLVWIHPFPNGNGRHARMMADALLASMGAPPFTWGKGADLVSGTEARGRYLAALRAADRNDYKLLLAFVRS